MICIAEICNPAQGSIIKCKVKAKNSLGVLAEGYYDNIPILEIIIPKISAGIQSEINIDTINIGDEIKIEVCGKKYQLFDKHISIIGRAIKSKDEYIKNSIVEDVDDNDGVIKDMEEDNLDEVYEENESTKPEDDEDDDDDKKTTGGADEEDELDDILAEEEFDDDLEDTVVDDDFADD